MSNSIKPIVQYVSRQFFKDWKETTRAVVVPVNHPSENVINEYPATTSPVLVETITPVSFETRNTKYMLKMEELPESEIQQIESNSIPHALCIPVN